MAHTSSPASSRTALHGFGRAVGSAAHFSEPTTVEALTALVAEASSAGQTLAMRGSGRSYGDAALNENQRVIGTEKINRILGFDRETGTIDVETGVTVEDLWQTVLPAGFWPAVVPGTMRPTIGGCVAANVHGKNNFGVGPIGDHVLDFDLLTPANGLITCSREQNTELFHAAIGGFGALGITTRLRLKLKPIETGNVDVRAINVPNIAALFEAFRERVPQSDYLVGWTDAFASGQSLGRSQIHQANYTSAADYEGDAQQSLTLDYHGLPDRFFGVVPKGIMWRLSQPLLNNPGMQLVNFGKFMLSRTMDNPAKPHRQGLVAFQFLLDYLPRWRDAYGLGGFIQVQPFVPAEAAEATFTAILKAAQSAGVVPYLAVFKRHRADDFLISHGLDGYSLAMDYKVTASNRRDVWALGQRIGDMVVEAGGHFYFAKDAVARPDQVKASFGAKLEEFAALKTQVDPDGLLTSDLWRRVAPELAGRSTR